MSVWVGSYKGLRKLALQKGQGSKRCQSGAGSRGVPDRMYGFFCSSPRGVRAPSWQGWGKAPLQPRSCILGVSRTIEGRGFTQGHALG